MGQKKGSEDLAAPAYRPKAARFNAHTLKRLQVAVEQDPEVDLTTKFPIEYIRLTEMRETDKKIFAVSDSRIVGSFCSFHY
jgi:hypothetical protein